MAGHARASLNESQRQAVEHEQGPLLVLAGAGSGKTRVIAQRIARLIERGVRPEAILAVSFTNKAAGEMAERVRHLVGAQHTSALEISTFHSFGLRFLSEEHKALGYPRRFVVCDQGDALGIIRELVGRTRRGDRRFDAMAVLARISLWKNQLRSPEALPESALPYDEVARDLYGPYQERLRAMCALDFDDLIVAPVRILQSLPDVRARWQQRYRHVLIDEFQDTNFVQYELVKLLVNELRNVCVVGDDDQSIYGWRGADVRNILEFADHFPGAAVVRLEDNYRSYAQILEAANAAIGQSPGRRYSKTLRAARGPGEPVRLCPMDDGMMEARFVAQEARTLRSDGLRFDEMAVLYRSNSQADLIEQELRAAGVPYRVFGGIDFFDRKEVKDACAYVRLILRPHDEIALRRVLNYPPRGIGPAAVTAIEAAAARHNSSFAQVIASDINNLPAPARHGLTSFIQALAAGRATFARDGSLAKAARALIDAAGIRGDLMDEGTYGRSGAQRWGNVEAFLAALQRFEDGARRSAEELERYLTRWTLRSEQPSSEEQGGVTLTTLHTAKGLEFRAVFLIGLVEGQLPHRRTTDPKITESAPADIEEERRLFYVGVTRAKDRLYLVYPKRRSLRGTVTPLTPSRFLEKLPKEHVVEYAPRPPAEMAVDDLAEASRALIARLAAART